MLFCPPQVPVSILIWRLTAVVALGRAGATARGMVQAGAAGAASTGVCRRGRAPGELVPRRESSEARGSPSLRWRRRRSRGLPQGIETADPARHPPQRNRPERTLPFLDTKLKLSAKAPRAPIVHGIGVPTGLADSCSVASDGYPTARWRMTERLPWFTVPVISTTEAIGQQMPKAKQCAVMNHDAMSMDYHEGLCLIQVLERALGF